MFDDCFREVIFRGLSCCTATLAKLLGHPDIVEVSDAVESIPSSRSSLCSELDILSLLNSFSVLSAAIAVCLFGFYEKKQNYKSSLCLDHRHLIIIAQTSQTIKPSY